QLLDHRKPVLIAGKPVAPPPSAARERKTLASREAKVCSRTAARVGSPSAVVANASTSPRLFQLSYKEAISQGIISDYKRTTFQRMPISVYADPGWVSWPDWLGTKPSPQTWRVKEAA